MATFRLTVTLGGGAKNMYTIIGSSKCALSMPAAYQTPHFGVNFGGVKKGVVDQIKAAGYDSWLTVGITDGSSGLGSAGINWKAWTASKGMTTKDGGVFWMNPKKTTATGTITVAQLTIKSGTKATATMGCSGRLNNGKTWRVDSVKFAMSGGPPPPPSSPPPPSPPSSCKSLVCPKVTQLSSSASGMATFRLSVTLGGGAKNMYTIIGSEKGTLSVPAAYQTPNLSLIHI